MIVTALPPAQHIEESDSGRTFRGNDRSNISLCVVLLGAADILQIFCPELFRVEVVGAGQSEDLPVSGISHPLIPLGTVGGNFDIVGFLPPDLILIEPVCERIVTCKMSGALMSL